MIQRFVKIQRELSRTFELFNEHLSPQIAIKMKIGVTNKTFYHWNKRNVILYCIARTKHIWTSILWAHSNKTHYFHIQLCHFQRSNEPKKANSKYLNFTWEKRLHRKKNCTKDFFLFSLLFDFFVGTFVCLCTLSTSCLWSIYLLDKHCFLSRKPVLILYLTELPSVFHIKFWEIEVCGKVFIFHKPLENVETL